MSRRFLYLIAFLMTCCVAGAGTPPPPAPDGPLIDALDYPSAQARTLWAPMGATAPVSVLEVDGRRVLRMPCNFRGTRIDRASWDRSLKLDLTVYRGLQFDFHCADVSPVSHFSLYLHSGDGWYAASFGQSARKGWGRVVVEKTQTRIEGKPGGWGNVDRIRISAWRGKGVDTEFHIANLALVGADAPVAVVRGESAVAKHAGEAESISRYSKGIANALDALGIDYTIVSDLDVTAKRLAGKRIVILPHNPAMPDSVAKELEAFVGQGGKLLSFYTLPRRLRDAVGIPGGQHMRQERPGHFAAIVPEGEGLPGMPPSTAQRSWNVGNTKAVPGTSRIVARWVSDDGKPTDEAAIVASKNAVHMTHVLLGDDPLNKRLLLLSMLGHLDPGLWRVAAESRLARAGRVAGHESFQAAYEAIRRQGEGRPAAAAACEEARAAEREARRLLAKKQYPDAIAAADRMGTALVRAYCAAQRPRKGEFRAFWCHSAFGPRGMTWDRAIKALAEHGFTAILPNMCWGGTAYYRSTVLPVAPEVAEQGDQIELCVAACRKYGIACHVWKVNWNMSRRAPKDFAERVVREGRTQVLYGGQAQPRWLCPSHPANQKLEIDAMVEVAEKYAVAGIHFDYIRYPGPSGCFCPGCRGRFEKVLARKVADWPRATRDDEAVRNAWLDFRRANITAVVAGVHERVRKRRPKVQISAAVFRNWEIDRDKVGQDWKVWCDRGYMDFVCPMDYTANALEFENLVRLQLGWAGRVPCYPGIGLSVWGSPSDVVKLIEHVRIARRLGAPGFTIFEYRSDVLPFCSLGITARE
jgi:uncharacterized lipoprotein YddW (UPF0748 family)